MEGLKPGPGPSPTFKARARPGPVLLGPDPSLMLKLEMKSYHLYVLITVDQILRFFNLARCEIHVVKSREIARSHEIEFYG